MFRVLLCARRGQQGLRCSLRKANQPAHVKRPPLTIDIARSLQGLTSQPQHARIKWECLRRRKLADLGGQHKTADGTEQHKAMARISGQRTGNLDQQWLRVW